MNPPPTQPPDPIVVTYVLYVVAFKVRGIRAQLWNGWNKFQTIYLTVCCHIAEYFPSVLVCHKGESQSSHIAEKKSNRCHNGEKLQRCHNGGKLEMSQCRNPSMSQRQKEEKEHPSHITEIHPCHIAEKKDPVISLKKHVTTRHAKGTL